jgi:nucleoside-diphosphate-sugar epimerase
MQVRAFFNFGLDSSHQSKQDTIMGISKILVVGATGYLGPFITAASVRLGHPTLALVRPATARPDSSKKELIESFKASGITILEVHTFNPPTFSLLNFIFISCEVQERQDMGMSH